MKVRVKLTAFELHIVALGRKQNINEGRGEIKPTRGKFVSIEAQQIISSWETEINKP